MIDPAREQFSRALAENEPWGTVPEDPNVPSDPRPFSRLLKNQGVDIDVDNGESILDADVLTRYFDDATISDDIKEKIAYHITPSLQRSAYAMAENRARQPIAHPSTWQRAAGVVFDIAGKPLEALNVFSYPSRWTEQTLGLLSLTAMGADLSIAEKWKLGRLTYESSFTRSDEGDLDDLAGRVASGQITIDQLLANEEGGWKDLGLQLTLDPLWLIGGIPGIPAKTFKVGTGLEAAYKTGYVASRLRFFSEGAKLEKIPLVGARAIRGIEALSTKGRAGKAAAGTLRFFMGETYPTDQRIWRETQALVAEELDRPVAEVLENYKLGNGLFQRTPQAKADNLYGVFARIVAVSQIEPKDIKLLQAVIDNGINKPADLDNIPLAFGSIFRSEAGRALLAIFKEQGVKLSDLPSMKASVTNLPAGMNEVKAFEAIRAEWDEIGNLAAGQGRSDAVNAFNARWNTTYNNRAKPRKEDFIFSVNDWRTAFARDVHLNTFADLQEWFGVPMKDVIVKFGDGREETRRVPVSFVLDKFVTAQKIALGTTQLNTPGFAALNFINNGGTIMFDEGIGTAFRYWTDPSGHENFFRREVTGIIRGDELTKDLVDFVTGDRSTAREMFGLAGDEELVFGIKKWMLSPMVELATKWDAGARIKAFETSYIRAREAIWAYNSLSGYGKIAELSKELTEGLGPEMTARIQAAVVSEGPNRERILKILDKFVETRGAPPPMTARLFIDKMLTRAGKTGDERQSIMNSYHPDFTESIDNILKDVHSVDDVEGTSNQLDGLVNSLIEARDKARAADRLPPAPREYLPETAAADLKSALGERDTTRLFQVNRLLEAANVPVSTRQRVIGELGTLRANRIAGVAEDYPFDPNIDLDPQDVDGWWDDVEPWTPEGSSIPKETPDSAIRRDPTTGARPKVTAKDVQARHAETTRRIAGIEKRIAELEKKPKLTSKERSELRGSDARVNVTVESGATEQQAMRRSGLRGVLAQQKAQLVRFEGMLKNAPKRPAAPPAHPAASISPFLANQGNYLSALTATRSRIADLLGGALDENEYAVAQMVDDLLQSEDDLIQNIQRGVTGDSIVDARNADNLMNAALSREAELLGYPHRAPETARAGEHPIHGEGQTISVNNATKLIHEIKKGIAAEVTNAPMILKDRVVPGAATPLSSLPVYQGLVDYLNAVSRAAVGAKYTAVTYGKGMADETMLNYGNKLGIDRYLSVIYPYEFWPTRTMWHWAQRARNRPGAVLSPIVLYNLISDMNEDAGIPERFQQGIRIPVPFLDEQFTGGSLYFDPIKVMFPLANWSNDLDFDEDEAPRTPFGELQRRAQNYGIGLNPFVDIGLGVLDGQDDALNLKYRLSSLPFLPAGPRRIQAMRAWIFSGEDPDNMVSEEIKDSLAAGEPLDPDTLKLALDLNDDEFDNWRAERMLVNMTLANYDANIKDKAQRESFSREALIALRTRKGKLWEKARKDSRRENALPILTGWALGVPVRRYPAYEAMGRGLNLLYGEAQRVSRDGGKISPELLKQFPEAKDLDLTGGDITADFVGMFPEFQVREAAYAMWQGEDVQQAEIAQRLFSIDVDGIHKEFDGSIKALDSQLAALSETGALQTKEGRNIYKVLETQRGALSQARSDEITKIDALYEERGEEISLNRTPRTRALQQLERDYYKLELPDDAGELDFLRQKQMQESFIETLPTSYSYSPIQSALKHWSIQHQFSDEIGKAWGDNDPDKANKLIAERDELLSANTVMPTRNEFRRYLDRNKRQPTVEEVEADTAGQQISQYYAIRQSMQSLGYSRSQVFDVSDAFWDQHPLLEKYYGKDMNLDIASTNDLLRYDRMEEIWDKFRSLEGGSQARIDYLSMTLAELNELRRQFNLPPIRITDPYQDRSGIPPRYQGSVPEGY